MQSNGIGSGGIVIGQIHRSDTNVCILHIKFNNSTSAASFLHARCGKKRSFFSPIICPNRTVYFTEFPGAIQFKWIVFLPSCPLTINLCNVATAFCNIMDIKTNKIN